MLNGDQVSLGLYSDGVQNLMVLGFDGFGI